MEIYKRLLKYLKPYWKQLAIAMVCMLGVGAMAGAFAFIFKHILDDIFIGKSVAMLKMIPPAIVMIFIVKGIFFYFQGYLMAYVGQRIVRDIRDELYANIQRQTLAFFLRNPTGTLMSRITFDVNLINQAVTNAFSSILRDSFTALSLAAVAFYWDWKMTLMAIFVYPVAMYPIIKLGKKLRKIGTRSQETMGYINTFLHETIAGARIVKAFGMENYETGRFAEANKKFFKLLMKSQRIKVITRPTMELLSSVGIALIIWFGGMKVMKGEMTTGEFFSFMAALLMLYKPLKQLSAVNNIIQEGISAAIRIFDVIDTVPDIRDKEGAIAVKSFDKTIDLKDLSFRYEKENVLKNINMKVKKGERVAIVGSSGSGKTTLVNLIPRFYDVTGGSITLDGHDIRDITIESLRSLIGIVTQETILFNDTVRNNIAYGRSEASEPDIIATAKSAYAHEFITEMPQGYDTIIGEQGLRLSGGQRQRLSIARAIMKNAPILILDEATSALDPESEKLVQNALNNLMTDRTTLVIAHRLSTVMNADRILVLHRGKIVEEGTHDELLAMGKRYDKLWKRQFSDT